MRSSPEHMKGGIAHRQAENQGEQVVETIHPAFQPRPGAVVKHLDADMAIARHGRWAAQYKDNSDQKHDGFMYPGGGVVETVAHKDFDDADAHRDQHEPGNGTAAPCN